MSEQNRDHQQERQREHQREREKEQKKHDNASSSSSYNRRGSFDFDTTSQKDKAKKSKPKLEMITVVEETPGQNNEKNLKVEWRDMPLPEQNAISAFFIATTKEGNQIEITMEQLSFKRNYQGKDRVETCYIPVAPDGTPGCLCVTDTTTGEFKKINWHWQWISGFSLWELIKKIFSAFTSR